MYSVYHLLAFFMFYAMAGWCTEVIYKTTCTGKFVNRGFLNGPLCPIYGCGVTIVILCLTPFQDNLLLLYVGSFLLTSLLEYLTGLILEKIFHQKWWDYSDEHFNLQGYVCLRFSLLWGLACVFVMRIIHPLVMSVIEHTPVLLRNVIFITFYTLMLADFIITVAALAKINTKLRLANDLDHMLNRVAEAVGTRLTAGTLKGMESYSENKEKFDTLKSESDAKLDAFKTEAEAKLENIKAETDAKLGSLKTETGAKLEAFKAETSAKLEALKSRMDEQRNTATGKRSFVHNRLEKAYPSLDFSRLDNEKMEARFAAIKDKLEKLSEKVGRG